MIDAITTYKDVTLYAGQVRAWRSKARFVQCVAGVQGGKTHFGPIWLSGEIAKWPGEVWIVCSPTYRMLKDITLPAWLEHVEDTEHEGYLIRGDMVYHLPDGGRILFRSGDRPNRVEGIGARGAWLDEADQMPEAIWTVIQARVGLRQGRVLFTTTPYPGGWMGKSVAALAKSGDPDYDLIQWAAVDNPYFPRAEFERARKTMNPLLFAMRYLGQFVELMGLVFPDYLQCVEPDRPVHGYKCAGMDFGFRDSTAVVYGVVDDRDVLHIVRAYKEAERTTTQHAACMDKTLTYHCDPTGVQLMADFAERGFYMVASDNDLLTGINVITERMRTGRLLICESAAGKLIEELRDYVFADDSKPRKGEDHLIHALEYVCKGLDKFRGWRKTYV